MVHVKKIDIETARSAKRIVKPSKVVQFRPHKLQAGGGSGLGLFITNGIVNLHGERFMFTNIREGLDAAFFKDRDNFRFAFGLRIADKRGF